MSALFQDKVVILTGASSGIGLETALAFARAGARVVLAARTQATLQEVVDAHPDLRDRLRIVPTDVTKEEDVRRLVATTMAQLGRVDILVNNAGIGMRAAIAEAPLDDARSVMEVNFFGPLRCIQTVLPHMRQQGAGQIVNIGSILSVVVAPRNGVYSASKFALLAMSDALRMELHGSGIEVISVLPAYTDTPFFEKMYRYGNVARMSPFKGQHPAQVAHAILYACAHHKRQVVLTVSSRIAIFLRRLSPRLLHCRRDRRTHDRAWFSCADDRRLPAIATARRGRWENHRCRC
jgi:short-subunit dehydrogenase